MLDPTPGLGGYVADAVLGEGGMGIVFRVAHPERSGGPWALKVLARPDRALARRLRREGELQARLDHPHVVRALDTVDLPRSVGLLMEYVAGPSLQQLLRGVDEPLPVAVVRDLGAQLLAGVAAAHRAGIVHRDLKPGNVLLRPVADRWEAAVTDFGLARVDQPVDSLITGSGRVMGTLAYAAPEQLRDARRVTPRSDVFSAGALLYELATGQRCFDAEDRVELLSSIAEGRYVPVLQRRADLDAELAEVIEAALRVDPRDRPADAGALLESWGPAPGATWPDALARVAGALHRPAVLSPASQRSREDNVPDPGDGFVGRAAERAALADELQAPGVVTLVGPGGVGKTRLAVEVARDVAIRFTGGVRWCDLSAARVGRGSRGRWRPRSRSSCAVTPWVRSATRSPAAAAPWWSSTTSSRSPSTPPTRWACGPSGRPGRASSSRAGRPSGCGRSPWSPWRRCPCRRRSLTGTPSRCSWPAPGRRCRTSSSTGTTLRLWWSSCGSSTACRWPSRSRRRACGISRWSVSSSASGTGSRGCDVAATAGRTTSAPCAPRWTGPGICSPRMRGSR